MSFDPFLSLVPPSVLTDAKNGPFELFRAVVLRTAQSPELRHSLGWAGVQELALPNVRPGVLTLKTQSMEGVYGILPVEIPHDQGARFHLFYFPSQNEARVRTLPLEWQEGVQAADFFQRVREFPFHPEMMEVFHVGCLQCLLGDGADEMMLVMGGATAPDKDACALSLAMPLYKCLTASFDHVLKTETSQVFTRSNQSLYEQTWESWYALTYGDSSRTDLRDQCLDPLAWQRHSLADTPLSPWGLNGSGNKGQRPRFILLTGFLGSGKTSFLNHFVQAQMERNSLVAVIQNEVGERGVDARLTQNGVTVVEMDEGCVCCSLAGNLRAAVSQANQSVVPDFIVLETTGVANPANILSELRSLEDIMEMGAVITVVDAFSVMEQLDRYELARDQIRLADTVLLNKVDLVAPEQMAAMEDRIRSLNPLVDIHPVVKGDIHPARILGVNFRAELHRKRILPFQGMGATHGKDQIQTHISHIPDPVNLEALLSHLGQSEGTLLRAKGIFSFDHVEGPAIFDYVPGSHQVIPLGDDPETGEGFLVRIGQGLPHAFSLFPEPETV